MTLLRKIDGNWQTLAEGPQVLTRTAATCQITYQDGRIEVDVPCDPYPVVDTIDTRKVEKLLQSGVWTQTDLDAYGLKVPVPFVPPEGKRKIGAASYVEDGDNVLEIYQVEDIPAPPPPPTKEEKVQEMLDAFGITKEDILSVVGDSKGEVVVEP